MAKQALLSFKEENLAFKNERKKEMIGMIVSGHGRFAEGISSAVEVIAGCQENWKSVNFLATESPEEYRSHLTAAINCLAQCSEIVIMTDLIGGTPFKIAAELSIQDNNKIRVFGGTNLAMLLGFIDSRREGSTLKEICNKLIGLGQRQIRYFEFEEPDKAELSPNEL